MNLTKAQRIRLGTFVTSGALLFMISVLSLAGLKVWEKRDLYTVRYKESVSGLERSAQVRYQGLRVGRVESMRIAPDDPTSIEITLALDPETILYGGTTAVLDVSGITGLKTINLTPGDPRNPRIAPGSRLPTGASLFDKITGQAEAIGVKAELVANQLARWTSDENRVRMEELIVSLTRLSKDLDAFVVDAREPTVGALGELTRAGAAIRGATTEGTTTMKELRAELAQTLGAFRGALAEAQRILGSVDSKSVEGTVRSAHSAMSSLDARLSSAELGATMSNLKTSLVNLTKLLQEMDLAVRASREDFVTSLAHVRQATEDLREFSRIIAQDPSVLIRGKEVEE